MPSDGPPLYYKSPMQWLAAGVRGGRSRQPDEAPSLPQAPPPGKGAKWRRIGSTRVRMMAKLDESQVRWIVRQRRKGTPVAEVAEAMHVSPSWVKKLASRYRNYPVAEIEFPRPMGRPRGGMPGRMERSAVLSSYYAHAEGATLLVDSIEKSTGLRVAHHVVHGILREYGPARAERGKSYQRSLKRFAKRYSNTMRHADCKMLHDGRWLVSCPDDASCRVMGWGAFKGATTANALKVLDKAIVRHGATLLSILSNHGSTFCDNESGGRPRARTSSEGTSAGCAYGAYGTYWPAQATRPQTNGKLERLHGEIGRKLRLFEEASAGRTTRSAGGGAPAHAGGPFHTAPADDPIDRFFERFNNDRPNMALDRPKRETPAQACRRRMPRAVDSVQKDLGESGSYA